MRSNLVESRKTVSQWVRLGVLLASFGFCSALIAQGPPPPPPPPPGGIPPLPPVPQPAQNPGTPEKELLGKFLFWETQLSTDSAVSCGTCHFPEAGGSDPRTLAEVTRHPGADGVFGNADDVMGSIGI
ncbi:MAG: cytochrome c peroxidase, partial [Planctomycetota bacterium]